MTELPEAAGRGASASWMTAWVSVSRSARRIGATRAQTSVNLRQGVSYSQPDGVRVPQVALAKSDPLRPEDVDHGIVELRQRQRPLIDSGDQLAHHL